MLNNIFYISPNNYPSRAAHTIHIMNMCQSFSKLGKKVTLVIPVNFKNIFLSNRKLKNYYSITDNVSIVKLPMPPTRIGLSIFCMLSFLLVSVYKSKLCYTRNFFIADVFTKMGCNTIFETHGLEFDNFKKTKISERISLLKVIVISRALLHMYKEENIDISKFLVAHDGANLVVESSENILPDYTDGKYHIGYVGHLYKGRGINLILNIANKRSQHLFHIVGGLEDDIAYWKNIASDMQVNNVIFEGYMKHSEVTILRRKFDILLAPYEQKVRVSGNTGDTSNWMSPLKIFEYMSDKKPILVSDLPVLHEVLKDKYSCLFCKVDDLNDWLKNLDILVENQEFSDMISYNAHQTLKECYTWNKRAVSIIDEI